LLQSRLGLKMVQVPYKGAAPAISDMLGGHLKLAIVDMTPAVPHVVSGKLKLLAVTGRTRSPAAPDVPTLEEAGIKDFEAVAWLAMFAPAGTPKAVLQRLSTEIRRGVTQPDVKRKIEETGAIVVAGTPDELGQFVASEIRNWGRLAREARIEPQ
ncbi:MAG TPA: tripartite tricarboxylate transporter substrate-binding protein, partial [Burkholderiales bacterium]